MPTALPKAETHTIIDISVPIHPAMPTYPGDPGVSFEPVMQMDNGDVANVTMLHLGSQTGTHFDTPHHTLNNSITAEQLPLHTCYGPAQVIAISEDIQGITADHLKQHDLSDCTRVLLKTRNSAFWRTHPETFQTHFAALTPDGAQYLVDAGIQLVGIDYLSIELYGSEHLGAHEALLSHNIVILEGIQLNDVEPGEYTLAAFPIYYQGLDGAPTRAVLIQ